MPRLLLIRHAEAAAHAPQGDLERPLTAQGSADAARMGAYCFAAALVPDLVLVSPALRARGTLEVMLREIPQKPAYEIEDALYSGDADDMQNLLERISPTVKTLLIVGHNPGLAEFARFLVDRKKSAGAALRHFPAPCLALIHFPCGDWVEAMAGGGRLDRFINFSCLPADDLLSR